MADSTDSLTVPPPTPPSPEPEGTDKVSVEIATYKDLHLFLVALTRLLEEVYELGIQRGEELESERKLESDDHRAAQQTLSEARMRLEQQLRQQSTDI